MKVTVNKPTEVEVKTMNVNLKVRDCFSASFRDENGNEIKDYEGYVPEFMPGDHYGDYVDLKIDLETGKILNWQAPSESALADIINDSED